MILEEMVTENIYKLKLKDKLFQKKFHNLFGSSEFLLYLCWTILFTN